MRRLISNRWIHFLLLSLLVVITSVFNMDTRAWRLDVSHAVFDAYNTAFPRPAPEDKPVVIVDIDDASLEELGQWPWPRTIIAKWVDNLTTMGAKAIVFDGVLAEPDRSSPHALLDHIENGDSLRPFIENMRDNDTVLAESIANSKIFVAGFTYANHVQTPRKPSLNQRILIKRDDVQNFLASKNNYFTQAAVFLPNLESASAGNGSFMAKPDHDGIIRTTPLLFHDGQTLYPSLSLEALRVAYAGKNLMKISKNTNESPFASDYMIHITEIIHVPVNADALFYGYYRSFTDDDYVSAHDVIDGTADWNAIKDKIVFIGSSAEGLKDLRSTSIQAFIPGVEVHANMTEQIIQSAFLHRPNVVIAAEAITLLCVGLLIILFAPFVHVAPLGLFTGGMIAALFTGGVYAFETYGLLFDPLYAGVSLFLIFVTSTILSYIRSEGERQQIRDAFGFYISPEYMEELTENPQKLKLGGDLRELTIMFTDIRRFTTISEGLDPEELIQLINDFLTPMSDLVMQNKGTIDKYNGDAMMAFWNAPLDVADHPRHACIAALSMQEALAPINAMVKTRAEERGQEPILLQAGIGINTGECAVGNMGSKQRFAYSALGDAVNIAARLEGQTKYYGADILIGNTTRKAVPDFAVLEADLIQVKGKTKPERIFILLGDETLHDDPAFLDFSLLHASFIDVYRGGNFKHARHILKDLQSKPQFGCERLYEIYDERIKTLLKYPPDDWNGVYVATSK